MMTTENAAARLRREVPDTEMAVDAAMLKVTALLNTMLTARLEAGIPAATGQREIMQLVKSQQALLDAGTAILRVHRGLSDMQEEVGVVPVHDCPEREIFDPAGLSTVDTKAA